MWLQKLIACALAVGISKRELLEDYYIDEIPEIFKAWNRIHGKDGDDLEPEHMDNPMKFFGEGGEVIG